MLLILPGVDAALADSEHRVSRRWWSCPAALGSPPSPVVSGARERLLQVCPQVFDVFAADANAQQIVGDDAALGGIAGATLQRRLDAAETSGVREDRDGIHQRVGAGGATAHAEGEHEPGTGERVAAALMLGMGD